LRIKSNISRGGLVRDIVYEDVCIRNTKNPIYMDPSYSAAPITTKDKPPTFTEITLRKVRIEGGGKITLRGLDKDHRLGMTFDGVSIDSSAKYDAVHADLQLGPGPVNFHPQGDDLKVTGSSGKGEAQSCEGKFVPLPAR
jgi:polygalacturonase